MHLLHECCGSLPCHHHLERVSIPGCHAGCRGRKRWILSVPVKGSLRMDAGAVRAVEQRSKSLFSAGIVAVSGDFSAQDAVALCDAAGRELGRGLCNYSAAEVDKIKVCAVVHLDGLCARLVAPQAKVFSFKTEMTPVALACGCPVLLGLLLQSVAPAFSSSIVPRVVRSFHWWKTAMVSRRKSLLQLSTAVEFVLGFQCHHIVMWYSQRRTTTC